MKLKHYKSLIKLIPWYINGTLSKEEYLRVNTLLNQDADLQKTMTAWNKLGRRISHQSIIQPSSNVESLLLERIASQSSNSRFHLHMYAVLLSTVALMIFWVVFRPGISLHWSIHNSHVDTFRVYRSTNGSSDYKLIYETNTKDDGAIFNYIDTLLIPWSSYSYVVKGIRGDAEFVISPMVTSQAIKVLPGQVALITASLVLGYAFAWLILYKDELKILVSLARNGRMG
jgi:hypothetical protein